MSAATTNPHPAEAQTAFLSALATHQTRWFKAWDTLAFLGTLESKEATPPNGPKDMMRRRMVSQLLAADYGGWTRQARACTKAETRARFLPLKPIPGSLAEAEQAAVMAINKLDVSGAAAAEAGAAFIEDAVAKAEMGV